MSADTNPYRITGPALISFSVNDRGIGTLYFRAKGTPCLGVVKGTPVSARSGEAGRGCAA